MSRPEDLCDALRAWRIAARLRQDAVARCLGVAQSQVSRWESGRDRPRPHNVEAIRRLIWGPEADPFTALRHFVANSTQNLLLLDAEHNVVAQARPFQTSPNLLDRFGWVLDPNRNPAFRPVHRRYREVMAHPNGVVGMSIMLPFLHEGAHWVAALGQTIHSAAGLRLCLAELTFSPEQERAAGVSFEEVRLGNDGATRNHLTLWRQPSA